MFSEMQALKFSFKEKKLELRKVPMPKIERPNEILIKVAFAGICGTDLHILAGEFPCRQTQDITLGHELCGLVMEVGNDVINFIEGDKVAVDPNMGCKRCAFCHAGSPHFCKLGCITNTIGIYKDGGWAQYLVCPEEQVFKLASGISLDQAVLAEPLSCMIHGWDLLGPIPLGQKILLTGAGIIGSLWACTLHLQGHKHVTVCDPNPKRLELSKKLNTGYKLCDPDELRRSAEKDPENSFFDVVIECSGATAAIEQGIGLLNYGGRFCLFGVTATQARIQVSPFDIFWKELKIIGVRVNPYTFAKALGVVESLGHRYLNYNTLGIQTFELSQYKEAIETLKKGTVIKVVFKM